MSGSAEACIDEVPYNTVRYDGPGVADPNIVVATEELAVKDLQHFTATKTVTVTDQGVSAIGIGSAESIISQSAADRVATIIATKMASVEISGSLPPVISLGEGFE
jgi:aspartate-semialdehyde dehydrogenase